MLLQRKISNSSSWTSATRAITMTVASILVVVRAPVFMIPWDGIIVPVLMRGTRLDRVGRLVVELGILHLPVILNGRG